MKKIKLVAAGLFVCSAALVGYKAYDNTTSQQQLLLQNVEALAKAEQPDISKCVEAKGWTCIALHPTDSKKDKEKAGHKWPE